MKETKRESKTLVVEKMQVRLPSVPGIRINGGNPRDSRIAPLLDKINALVDQNKISMEEYIGLVDEVSKLINHLAPENQTEMKLGVDPSLSPDKLERIENIEIHIKGLKRLLRLYLGRNNRSKMLGEKLEDSIMRMEALHKKLTVGKEQPQFKETKKTDAWDDDWRKALNDVRYLIRVCRKMGADVDTMIWLESYKMDVLGVIESRKDSLIE